MKTLKWIAIVLGTLIALAVIVVAVLHFAGQSRLNNAQEVVTRPVSAATDAEAVTRGDHIVNTISLCVGCHGPNLEGDVFINEAPIGYIGAPNLTPGQGGIGATYTDEDWERALRHGIGKDGRALVLMPSGQLSYYSDADLAAVIAYLKQVPAVDNTLEPRNITFPGTIIFGILAFNDVIPAASIDHANVGANVPEAGATAAYGEYLSHIALCRDCHGPDLAGSVDPNAPPGPNITPGSEVQGWSEEDFITTIRTGVTPAGNQLSEEMPWELYMGMSDMELQALWAYLQSLPARPTAASE